MIWGRVVIPKEIRRTLRIKEGTPLEIFTDREGEVILKKYSPIGELSISQRRVCGSLIAGYRICVLYHRSRPGGSRGRTGKPGILRKRNQQGTGGGLSQQERENALTQMKREKIPCCGKSERNQLRADHTGLLSARGTR